METILENRKEKTNCQIQLNLIIYSLNGLTVLTALTIFNWIQTILKLFYYFGCLNVLNTWNVIASGKVT